MEKIEKWNVKRG
jgi:hypothetical protein